LVQGSNLALLKSPVQYSEWPGSARSVHDSTFVWMDLISQLLVLAAS
jgi:hypothetical protein